jgi:hypothetical protein
MALKKKAKGSFWDRLTQRDEREFVVDLPIEEVLALLDMFQKDWEFRRLFIDAPTFFEMNVITLDDSYIGEMSNGITLNLSTHDTTKTMVYLSRQVNRGCEIAIAAFFMVMACPVTIILCSKTGFLFPFVNFYLAGLVFLFVLPYLMEKNPANKRRYYDMADAFEAMLITHQRVPLPKRK